MLVMNWARSQGEAKYFTKFSRKWNELFPSSLETSHELTLYSFFLVRRRIKWSRVLIRDRMKYLSYLMVRLTPHSMIKWLWIQIKSLQQRRNFEYVTINFSPKSRLGRTDQWGPQPRCQGLSSSLSLVAQWWEHSPLTNMARVRYLNLRSYVGWVCLFSSLLWGILAQAGFPLP